MEELCADTLGHVASFLDIASASRASILSKRTHELLLPSLTQRRAACDPYLNLVRVLRTTFASMEAVEKVGLHQTFRDVLTCKQLSWRDVLLMEDGLVRDVACIFLGHYTRVNGEVLTLTVGSVVHSLTCQPPINTFFRGFAHPLRIYAKTSCYQMLLPDTREGRFFSWGYASRVGGVGDMNSAPRLHAHLSLT